MLENDTSLKAMNKKNTSNIQQLSLFAESLEKRLGR
jgi:hypothetical protein